jgi:hypothetical protein
MKGFAERVNTVFLIPILQGATGLVVDKKTSVSTLKYKKEAVIPGIKKTSGVKGSSWLLII